ncbi:MAG TPA: prepilin-type N-terminal cleavage/methylation domain-containing protein [Chthoniobacterales bacterium]|jgi:prepilin-type N-terminal cleavage/methylation domain-containing protein
MKRAFSCRRDSCTAETPDSSGARAFTLTELLVTMAILSSFILLLFAVVDGTTQTWNQSEQRVDSFREARAALFIITRDLQTMVPAPDLGPEPYPTPTPTPTTSPVPTPTPMPTPNGVADFQHFHVVNDVEYLTANPQITFPQPAAGAQLGTRGISRSGESDALFFMAASEPKAQVPNPAAPQEPKSDVALVGYYQRYDPPAAGAPPGTTNVFKLYRFTENSDRTFQRIKSFTADPPTEPVLIAAPSPNDEVLARNVIDFRVKAYDEAMANIVPWDPRRTPYAVDISITAYNYSTANRFLNRADWMNFTSAKNAPFRRTFSTRVYLPRR